MGHGPAGLCCWGWLLGHSARFGYFCPHTYIVMVFILRAPIIYFFDDGNVYFEILSYNVGIFLI